MTYRAKQNWVKFNFKHFITILYHYTTKSNIHQKLDESIVYLVVLYKLNLGKVTRGWFLMLILISNAYNKLSQPLSKFRTATHDLNCSVGIKHFRGL